MESNLHCPACDSDSMILNQSEYEVEHFGTVLLSVSSCKKCGYKHTDVTTLTEQEPIALTAKITSLDDLNIRVIKSGTATVSIPEFRATITPGPHSEGYISNAEGVLDKVADALMFMLGMTKGKELRKGERLLRKIQTAKDHKPNFTLVIKDPLGNSAIVSPEAGKVKKRRLTNGELSKLKFGQYTERLELKPEKSQRRIRAKSF